jgi:DNA-binding NarL/FixJ family response regulator
MGSDALIILSPREGQILDLVAAGLPNKAIAFQLSVSISNVKTRVSALLLSLHAGNRVGLCRWALSHPSALHGDAVCLDQAEPLLERVA